MIHNTQHLNILIPKFKFTKGAELGVRRGDFSADLLNNNPNLHMICVDLWGSDPSLNENHDHNSNYKIYLEKTKEFRDRITEHRMLLDDAAKLCEDCMLDFVFIDATHTYNAVRNDYYTWLPKVRMGGLMCGHDYHPEFDNGGMVKAIKEFDPSIIELPSYFPGNTDMSINVGKTIELLESGKSVADCQTNCWFIWKTPRMSEKGK